MQVFRRLCRPVRSSLLRAGNGDFHTAAPHRKNPYYFYDLAKKQPKHTFDPNDVNFGDPQLSQEERVKLVFGQLGSRESHRTEAELHTRKIAGILVPPKPEEPTNCCMSGCVNCVWELYKDELGEWKESVRQAKLNLLSSKEPWPQDFGPEPSRDSGNVEKLRKTLVEDTSGGLDDLSVSMRQFVLTEERIRKKRAKEKRDQDVPLNGPSESIQIQKSI